MKNFLIVLCLVSCGGASTVPNDAAADAGPPTFSSVCFLTSKDIGVYCSNTTPDSHSWAWDQSNQFSSCNQAACPSGATCSVYTDVSGVGTELLTGTCE